ncbi:MAG: FHA domain-containing protein [Planctomycetota bacterium]
MTDTPIANSPTKSTEDDKNQANTNFHAMDFAVTYRGQPSRRLRLTGYRYTFGSAEGCSIRVSNDLVRPIHAVLHRVGDSITIRSYSEPLVVNDTAVTSSELNTGDGFKLGNYVFTLTRVSGNPNDSIRSTADILADASGEDVSASIDASGVSKSASALSEEATAEDDEAWRKRLRHEVDQWRDRQKEVDRRWDEADRWEARLRGQESELELQNQRLDQKQSEVDQQRDAVFALHDVLAARERSLESVLDEMRRQRESMHSRQVEFDQIQSRYEERLADTLDRLASAQGEARTAAESVDQLRHAMNGLNGQIESLVDRQTELESAAEGYQNQQQLQVEVRSQIEAQRDHAIDAQATSEARLRLAENRVSELSSQLESLNEEKEQLDLDRQQLESQRAEIARRSEDEQSRNELAFRENEQSLIQSQETIEKLQSEIEELHANVEASGSQARDLELENESALVRISSLEEQLRSSTEDTSEREASEKLANELRTQLQNVEDELARTQGELSDLRDRNADLTEEVRSLREERNQAVEAEKLSSEGWEHPSSVVLETPINATHGHSSDAAEEIDAPPSDHTIDDEQDVGDVPANASIDATAPLMSRWDDEETASDSESSFHAASSDAGGSHASGKDDFTRESDPTGEAAFPTHPESLSEPDFSSEPEPTNQSEFSDEPGLSNKSEFSNDSKISNERDLSSDSQTSQDADFAHESDESGHWQATARLDSFEAGSFDKDQDSSSTSGFADEAIPASPWNVEDTQHDHTDTTQSSFDSNDESRSPSQELIDPNEAPGLEAPDSVRWDRYFGQNDPVDDSEEQAANGLTETDSVEPTDSAFIEQRSTLENHELECSTDSESEQVDSTLQLESEETQEEPNEPSEHDEAASESQSDGFASALIAELTSESSDETDSTQMVTPDLLQQAIDDDQDQGQLAENTNQNEDSSIELDRVEPEPFAHPVAEMPMGLSDADLIDDAVEPTPASPEPADHSLVSTSTTGETSMSEGTGVLGGNEAGDEEEEDSIEAYMNRLLGRVQGSPGEEAAPASTIITPTVVDDISESDDDVEPIGPDEPLVPRSHAPERGRDLAAMRDLANQQARTAITRSTRIQIRNMQLSGFINFGVAAVAVAIGIGCSFIVSATPLIFIWLMVFACVFIFCKDGFKNLVEAKSRLSIPLEDEPETDSSDEFNGED